MVGERQDGRWVIHPSLWFDAVCLIPLLAGLPFYTSRHEQDARWWQERFASMAGQQARDAVSVLREEVAAQALDQFLNTQLRRNTRGDPATRWTTADDGMHVLALLLYDTLGRGGYDPAAGSYADFLARALSDATTWPRDLEARYLELTATRDGVLR